MLRVRQVKWCIGMTLWYKHFLAVDDIKTMPWLREPYAMNREYSVNRDWTVMMDV